MKSSKLSSLWNKLKARVTALGALKISVYSCGAIVIVALIIALSGTFGNKSTSTIVKKLYGEPIGDNGLRYKYGEHIYDPETGKIVVDSIEWLYVGMGDSIGILAKHNKRAYINLNNAQLITPLEYNKAWAFSSDRGVMIKKDSIYILRRDGSVVNSQGLHYKGQHELQYYHNQLILQTDNSMYGILDTAANWVLEPQYKYIDNNYQHMLYSAKTEEQCIVYNYDLDTILIGNYKDVNIDWSEGIVATEFSGIQHLFDYKGKMVYEVIYKEIRDLMYNTHRKDKNGQDIYESTDCYVYVNYNNKCGLMDKRYHVLTPPTFYNIEAQGKHLFFASFGEYNKRFGTLIDDHGKPIR